MKTREEEIQDSIEKYRKELLADGWREGDDGFQRLMALHEHFERTPKEELEKIWKEVEETTKNIQGPTVDEYMESLNPQQMYRKGYSDGAAKFRDLLIEHFRTINSPINLKGIDHNGNAVFVEIDKYSRTQIIEIINNVFTNN